MLCLVCSRTSVTHGKMGSILDGITGQDGGRAWKRFDKGPILDFQFALFLRSLRRSSTTLHLGSLPIDLFGRADIQGNVTLVPGSCLVILPTLKAKRYSALLTSPPYCNRYDYTRTYALELALLGVDEAKLRSLRQEMLTCTVENRAKDLLAINPNWKKAIEEIPRSPRTTPSRS